MTRHSKTCRCCGGPSPNPYCGPCGTHHARHANTVRATIRRLFGATGLTQYQTDIQAQRLAGRRTARPERTEP